MPVEPANLALLYSACRLAIEFVHKTNGSTISGSATGFFVRQPNGRVVLFTNRHAIECEYFNSKYVGYELKSIKVAVFLKASPETVDPPDAYEVTLDDPRVTAHSDDTVDLASIGLAGSVLAGGRDGVQVYSINQSSLATQVDFDTRIDVGEIAFFPGFPEWFDKSEFRPILRYGRVVSDPRRDYRAEEGSPTRSDGNQQLAIEAFSFSGNSGSPVFLEKHGNISLQAGLAAKTNLFHRPQLIIGINGGHLTASPEKKHGGDHSGLSIVYKSTAILELLRPAR
jgi:hypothetical protein